MKEEERQTSGGRGGKPKVEEMKEWVVWSNRGKKEG